MRFWPQSQVRVSTQCHFRGRSHNNAGLQGNHADLMQSVFQWYSVMERHKLWRLLLAGRNAGPDSWVAGPAGIGLGGRITEDSVWTSRSRHSIQSEERNRGLPQTGKCGNIQRQHNSMTRLVWPHDIVIDARNSMCADLYVLEAQLQIQMKHRNEVIAWKWKFTQMRLLLLQMLLLLIKEDFH